MRQSILIVIISLLTIEVVAQISSGGTPYLWSNNSLKFVSKTIALKSPQIHKLSNVTTDKNGAFTFAKLIEFNKSTDEIGEWTVLDNGDKLWTVRLKSEGAYSLNIQFSRYLLPEGASVYIYTPNKKHIIGAFTHENNKAYGSLAIAPMPGDEIIIEYYEPVDVEFDGELIIGSIGHAYLNVFGEKDGEYGASGSCNFDINCAEGDEWQSQKRAICRMIVDGSELCTGALLNNSSLNQDPYVLSANHCVNTEQLANNTVFVFNYESASCEGKDGSVAQSISGASLMATKNNDNGNLDFTLMKISKSIPLDYKPYFAGWNSSGTVPVKTTCIHHPSGDVKKISHDFDVAEVSNWNNWEYDQDSFWKINAWDKGTTEGGSSGSPLFDQNKNIVGTLTGGGASCSNLNGSDFFQMFSFSYDKYEPDSTQLKHWLDPTNSGITTLEGLDTDSTEVDIKLNAYSQINIYPTIVTSEITIDINDFLSNGVSICVYNYLGRPVLMKDYRCTDNTITFDVSSLQKGFYLMSIKMDGKSISRRFIKQ